MPSRIAIPASALEIVVGKETHSEYTHELSIIVMLAFENYAYWHIRWLDRTLKDHSAARHNEGLKGFFAKILFS